MHTSEMIAPSAAPMVPSLEPMEPSQMPMLEPTSTPEMSLAPIVATPLE